MFNETKELMSDIAMTGTENKLNILVNVVATIL
jgi:hypothetical protein